jgi:hypothetical protein
MTSVLSGDPVWWTGCVVEAHYTMLVVARFKPRRGALDHVPARFQKSAYF